MTIEEQPPAQMIVTVDAECQYSEQELIAVPSEDEEVKITVELEQQAAPNESISTSAKAAS